MKIVAIANGGFAIPSLKAIKESQHDLVALFAMPLRTKRSGGKAGIPPIRSAIDGFLSDVPLYEPENINSEECVEILRNLNADIIFICDYGKILSNEVLKTTKYGGINLHGSLLPKYRGAAPINRAIQAGEKVVGVSVIFIEPMVDAGPIVEIGQYEPTMAETAVEIEERLARIGAPLVIEALEKIESGTFTQIPQDASKASKAPKLRKEEGQIVWNNSSEVIIDQYRAFQPWPRVYSDWIKYDDVDKKNVLRVILGPFSKDDGNGNIPNFSLEEFECGEVVFVTKTEFWIKTSNGALRTLGAQPAGKKYMTSEVFLRGYHVQVHDKFQ